MSLFPHRRGRQEHQTAKWFPRGNWCFVRDILSHTGRMSDTSSDFYTENRCPVWKNIHKKVNKQTKKYHLEFLLTNTLVRPSPRRSQHMSCFHQTFIWHSGNLPVRCAGQPNCHCTSCTLPCAESRPGWSCFQRALSAVNLSQSTFFFVTPNIVPTYWTSERMMS